MMPLDTIIELLDTDKIGKFKLFKEKGDYVCIVDYIDSYGEKRVNSFRDQYISNLCSNVRELCYTDIYKINTVNYANFILKNSTPYCNKSI